MKSLKNPLLLILVWIISLFALCLSFMFYSKEGDGLLDIISGTLILMIYSVIFSFPAFLFFFLASYFTLRSEKFGIRKKKMIMLAANLTDIILTFGAMFVLLGGTEIKNFGTKSVPAIGQFLGFYPMWVLVFVSSALILVLPFNFNKSK